jgi:hypothetical protein
MTRACLPRHGNERIGEFLRDKPFAIVRNNQPVELGWHAAEGIRLAWSTTSRANGSYRFPIKSHRPAVARNDAGLRDGLAVGPQYTCSVDAALLQDFLQRITITVRSDPPHHLSLSCKWHQISRRSLPRPRDTPPPFPHLQRVTGASGEMTRYIAPDKSIQHDVSTTRIFLPEKRPIIDSRVFHSNRTALRLECAP